MIGRSTTISSFLSVCLWAFLMSACNPERPPDYGVECDPEDVSACSQGMECVWKVDRTNGSEAWRCSVPCSVAAGCPRIWCGQVCSEANCDGSDQKCEEDGYCMTCQELLK